MQTIVARHRQVDPSRITRLLRGDLDWIVMKALEKDRTRRFETANGFAEDIRRYLRSEPVMARPSTGLYRLRRFVARNKLPAGAAACVGLALGLSAVVSSWQWYEAARERKRAEEASTLSELRRAEELLGGDLTAPLVGTQNALEKAYQAYSAVIISRATPQSRRNKLLLGRSSLLRLMNRLEEAAADNLRSLGVLARDPEASEDMVDLSLHYNAGLKANWHGDVPQNNLASLPTIVYGVQETPFDCRGLIQLRSADTGLARYPHFVQIRMGRYSRKIHFLHACVHGELPAGTEIGKYTIHFAGKEPRQIPLILGRNTSNWWSKPNEDMKVDGSGVAWRGTNGKNTGGTGIWLIETTWDNAFPATQIETLEFSTAMTRAAPFLVAITTEPAGHTVRSQQTKVHGKPGPNDPRLEGILKPIETFSASNPQDTVLPLKAAALHVWFGKKEDYLTIFQRTLKLAENAKDPDDMARAAMIYGLRPIPDSTTADTALALVHNALAVGKRSSMIPWYQLTLGVVEYRRGEYQAADETLNKAENASLRAESSEHVRRAAGFFRAMTLLHLRNEPEALRSFNRAQQGMQPLLGDEQILAAGDVDHEDLILWLAFKEARGLLNEREAFYNKELAQRQNVHGAVYQEVNKVISQLAQVRHMQGKFAESEAGYSDAVAMSRKLFGEQQPEVAGKLEDLAVFLRDQKRLPEAEAAIREAVTIRRQQPDQGEVEEIRAVSLLCELLRSQGKLTEMEGILNEQIGKFSSESEPAQAKFAQLLRKRGELHLERSEFTKAEQDYGKALETFRRLQTEHPETEQHRQEQANTLRLLSGVMKRARRLPEAEDRVRSAFALYDGLAKERPDWTFYSQEVANTRRNLMEVLNLRGKFDEVETLSREALAVAKVEFGDLHREVDKALADLVKALQRQRKWDEAENIQRQELALERKLSGDEHLFVANSLHNLGLLLKAAGKSSEAEEVFREAAALRRRLDGLE